MKYRNLPGTGTSVSNLALGAMGFGTETEESEAFAILDRFIEANGNLVDTSNVYGKGASEEIIGRWFASRPADVTERVVLASKARFGTGPDVALGLQVPVTLQLQYNLVSREIEFEIVPAALYNNIGLLPWSPLAAGFLSGKYERDQKAPSDARGGAGSPMNDYIFGDLASKDQNWATLDAVRSIAKKLGVEPSQVAYSWVANRPGVTAPIMGAKTLKQLESNLIAADLELDEESTDLLDEVSAPTPNEYPYGPFGVKQRDRYVDSSDQAIGQLY